MIKNKLFLANAAKVFRFLIFFQMLAGCNCIAQELYPIKSSNKLWHDKELELRYKPDGKDFVITNGNRLFTRALYGTHTAFRVETGDRPEFALYMPGMGGNFKLGIASNNQSKWLTHANTITARYRPGARLYTIEDSLLGKGKLYIEILAMADAEGFILKTSVENVSVPVQLHWAFGGATGKKFSRDGDMGPDPESSFYLKAENCKNNNYNIEQKGKFTLQYGAGLQVGPDGRYFIEDLNQASKQAPQQQLIGVFNPTTSIKISDATELSSPLKLYQSNVANAPVITGTLPIENNKDQYISIYNPSTKKTLSYSELPFTYKQAEAARKKLADRIQVTTPDPFINTIGGALSVASDAIWESPVYMHGSIGWRMPLTGWRGPYTADALGWHDRARTHLQAYAMSQFTSPESGPVVPDTAMNLARSWEKNGIGMFTNGYISRAPDAKNMKPHHYDMNLVYIDALLRHFAWTGDTSFMKKTWPVLKRHLEWEQRNFDADSNNLFDAYASIWASDALQYSGGDVSHSSSYNFIAFKRAAQIAKIVGEDPEPYKAKADKIFSALNRILWLPKKGTYAEFKDRLGNQLLHPSAALWTIYHSIDSEVPDKFQAYQSLRYLDNKIPHIPIKAKGLIDDDYYTIATTSWMPYMWSLNNVALAESMHASLANWQGGRNDEAFKLFKSEVIQSMYLGGSPGNIVQISYFDAVRGEAYRDFADPIGMFSRALVEGLFGIVPDALSKTLTIKPGLPQTWNHASFSTPDILFDFKRDGKTDTYKIVSKLKATPHLKFQIIAQGQVESITLNGKSIAWRNIADAVGKPVIEISTPAASLSYNIKIVWHGNKPNFPPKEKTYSNGRMLVEKFADASVISVSDPQNALQNIKTTGSGFAANVETENGDYTVFVQLKQGALSWWMPVCFKVASAIELVSTKDPEQNSNSFKLHNHTAENIVATVSINDFKTSTQIAAEATSDEISVRETELILGTNNVHIDYGNGKAVTAQLINWNGRKQTQFEVVNMTSHFNDKVTQIFKNRYLSPRPQTTTLQLPWQGIGDWPHPHETFEVDDKGLRKMAGENNTIILPQGLRFETPGDSSKNNILFTSQWDNYPDEQTVPLTGKASHAWFLMAGSTNPMQSQFTNGEVVVNYADGTHTTLDLRNPETWWPIDQDYYTDGFAFSLEQPRPIRIHLKSGNVVGGDESISKFNGAKILGGAATVLDLPLDVSKTLQSIKLKTIANDVVIGLMGITLSRN